MRCVCICMLNGRRMIIIIIGDVRFIHFVFIVALDSSLFSLFLSFYSEFILATVANHIHMRADSKSSTWIMLRVPFCLHQHRATVVGCSALQSVNRTRLGMTLTHTHRPSWWYKLRTVASSLVAERKPFRTAVESWKCFSWSWVREMPSNNNWNPTLRKPVA